MVNHRRTALIDRLMDIQSSSMTRRDVLRRAMVLGVSTPVLASLLAACGDDEDDADIEPSGDSDTTDTDSDPAAEDDEEETETEDIEDEDADEEETEESDETDEDTSVSDNRDFAMAFFGGVPDLDPQSAYDNQASTLFLGIYEMLIRFDGESTFDYQPMLAREWEANDDMTEFTFTIAENAMFHDGTVCDAEAVKQSFTRFLEMGRGPVNVISRFVDDADAQIEAVDEVTVKFTMNKAEPLFLPAMASSYGPFVVSPTAWEENATDSDPYAHEWFSQNVVGTGPYKVTEAEQQERFVLDRFEDYHSEPPFFDRLIARVIPEDPTRRQLLESGEIHGVNVLPSEDLVALEESGAAQVVRYDSTQTNWVRMNYALIPDPQARLGFTHAFPYQDVNEQVYLGFAYQQGPIADTLIGYDPDIELHETDLDLAQQLLTDAGIQEGETFTYMYASGDANDASIAQLFQANLAQIGITLELQQVDRAALLDLNYGDAPPEERPHFNSGGWWPDYNDSWNQLYPNFHSDSAGSDGSNSMFYQNEDFDALLDQLELAETEEEIQDLTSQAVEILMWEDPGGIFYQQVIRATSLANDIRGFIPNGIYINAYNFHEMSREA